MPDVTIEQNDKTYILRDVSNDQADVESTDTHSEGNDVYWNYSCVGKHDGDAINIAVKNARYEPDSDGESIFYSITHDGMFWADDLTELDEDVADWYSDPVMDVVKEDFNSL